MKITVLTIFLGVLALLACSTKTEQVNPYPNGHQSQYPTCDAIIKQCHPLDVGEGPIHDCHDLGHAAEKDEDCLPKKDDCLLRICVPNSDAGVDAGATDAKTD